MKAPTVPRAGNPHQWEGSGSPGEFQIYRYLPGLMFFRLVDIENKPLLHSPPCPTKNKAADVIAALREKLIWHEHESWEYTKTGQSFLCFWDKEETLTAFAPLAHKRDYDTLKWAIWHAGVGARCRYYGLHHDWEPTYDALFFPSRAAAAPRNID